MRSQCLWNAVDAYPKRSALQFNARNVTVATARACGVPNGERFRYAIMCLWAGLDEVHTCLRDLFFVAVPRCTADRTNAST